MNKVLMLIGLLVVLSFVFSLVACSSSSSSSTTTAPVSTSTLASTTTTPVSTTSQPSTSTSAPASVITLSMAPINCGPPPAAGLTTSIAQWADLIQTKTGGRVKIDIYWGQTLSPVNQIVNNTSTGVADIGGVAPAQEPGKLPLSMVAQLPGYGTDYTAQCLALWDMMNQEPLLSEYGKYNLLPLSLDFVPDYHLISNKPINSVADLKGKRISCAGFIADTVKALGGVPVAMSPTEQYEGLQKGTIDGNGAPYSAISDFKFYEVAKYIENFNFGGRVQPILINKDSWNKLPADIQAIFKSTVSDMIQFNYTAVLGQGEPLFPLTDKIIQDNKLQMIQITDADQAAITQVQAGQASAWAADLESKGSPANKLLTDYKALVDKYLKSGK